jgi:crotonobetainyl-CoA:carnitine CoA-transferase CaiB-like acyl-CoA transferase
MSETPGEIRWTGRDKGSDTHEILRNRLGLSDREIVDLVDSGVVYDAEE